MLSIFKVLKNCSLFLLTGEFNILLEKTEMSKTVKCFQNKITRLTSTGCLRFHLNFILNNCRPMGNIYFCIDKKLYQFILI